MGYRVPKEWATLDEGQRAMGSLAGFKRGSRRGFLDGYGANVCVLRGCYVCGGGRDGGEDRNVGAAGVRRDEGEEW